MLGIMISKEEYEEYMYLRKKDTPMKKMCSRYRKRCPVCGYVVDSAVPPQNYCDRCGQRLIKY